MLIIAAKAGATSVFPSPSQLLAQVFSKHATWWKGDLGSRIHCVWLRGGSQPALKRPQVVGKPNELYRQKNWVCFLAVWPKRSHLTSLSLSSLYNKVGNINLIMLGRSNEIMYVNHLTGPSKQWQFPPSGLQLWSCCTERDYWERPSSLCCRTAAWQQIAQTSLAA